MGVLIACLIGGMHRSIAGGWRLPRSEFEASNSTGPGLRARSIQSTQCPTTPPPHLKPKQAEEPPQEEQPDPLKEALEAAEETAATDAKAGIAAYHAVLATPGREGDEAAQRIKEEAIYRCVCALCVQCCLGRSRARSWT